MRFFRGGSEVGPQTLSRFYAMHVLMLPAALLVFVAVHLFMVVRQGISAPPKRHPEYGRHGINAELGIDPGIGVDSQLSIDAQRSRATNNIITRKKAASPSLRFIWPRTPSPCCGARGDRDFGLFVSDRDRRDRRPLQHQLHPRPDWYFLFLFQALKYFPEAWKRSRQSCCRGLR